MSSAAGRSAPADSTSSDRVARPAVDLADEDASRETRAPGADSGRIEVWTRRDQLDEHAASIDDLLDHVGAPVTASRRWWRAWLEAFPDVAPWMVARVDDSGQLVALAPLARRTRAQRTELVVIGDGVSDYARLPSRAEHDAVSIAGFIADHLHALRGPWSLALRQLPLGDPVAGSLVARLRHARKLEGMTAPRVEITERDITQYVSRNYRKGARNLWNRLERAGHQPQCELLTRPDAVAGVLDEVVTICRAREREMVGRSHLDDPRRERFFRSVAMLLAEEQALELALLRAGGRIVAYQVNLLDGPAYRSWNAHFDPPWGDYGPGHVLTYRILERVVNDDRYDQFDWMAGLESYKLRAATDTVRTQDLVAWSSGAVALTAFGPRLLRERLEAASNDDERAARALEMLRAARSRMQRVRAR